MVNRFKIPALRRQYDLAVRAYRNRHKDLVRPDGAPHRGNTVAAHFWRGYEGVNMNWDTESRTACIYAAYRAGQDMRTADDEDTELRRAIGLPPLSR